MNTQICTNKKQSSRLLEAGVRPDTADMYLDEFELPVAFEYRRIEGHVGQDMAFPAYYQGFIAGVEWEMAEAINAHWKSCPNLSKDNDRMCNQMNDCNQNCEYMRSFIRLLEE